MFSMNGSLFRRIIAGTVVWTVLGVSGADSAMAYESNYEPTAVGVIEIKNLPPARVLQTEGSGDYYDVSDGLFMTLFRYLKKHDLSMTVPVEADPKPGRMRFFVERENTRALPSGEGGVSVLERPAVKVASIGVRGGYSRENFEKGLAELRAWLEGHPAWMLVGEPYAVFWNGPFTPWFLKRSEIHVPVVGR
jgi:DNA gyrase inhibitor GyrI